MKFHRLMACAIIAAAAAWSPAHAQPAVPTPPVVVQSTGSWDHPAAGSQVTVTTTAKPAPVVDVSPVVEPLLQALTVVLTTLATAASGLLVRWLHLQGNVQFQAWLDGIMAKGIGAGVQAIRNKYAGAGGAQWTVAVQSEFVAHVAQWLISNYPAAAKRVGITLDAQGQLTPAAVAKIAGMVKARLGVMQVEAASDSAHPVAAAMTAPLSLKAPA